LAYKGTTKRKKFQIVRGKLWENRANSIIAATAATLLPHLKYLILKAFQQICGSSGSNFVKNKNIWNATWGLAPE
jgi:hypothetical protein